MPERTRPAAPPTSEPPPAVEPPPPAASPPHPRVEDVFVGRGDELKRIAAALFPANGARRPVVVSGMAGVGKSYLIDRVYWDNRERFPGGYIKLPLDPANPGAAADLLAALRDRLKLPATASPADRLQMPLTLLHIENADNFAAAGVAADLAAMLPGCALVISARFQELGSASGWPRVPLLPFDETNSLQQLAQELGPDAPGQADWPALAGALGHLPLALHLAAGYLRHRSAADFLDLLRRRSLALSGLDPSDETFRQRSHKLLSEAFDLSLEALRQEGGDAGAEWLAGLAALGHMPATGFGMSLGAAVAGLAPDAFADLTEAAERLSLIERVPRGAGNAFRLHPLLAELLRSRARRDPAFARMTEWFLARLPEGGDDQGSRWREIHDEIAALIEWLAQIPPADRVRVDRAGNWYAMLNGPYHAWLRFCEEALAGEIGDADRSNFLWTLGQVALRGGLPDRALAAAKEKRDLDRKRGDDREAANAASLIADILEARGEFDEGLRIRTEEELPVYERLGDVHSRAITQGQIADILQARGDFDAALRIRSEEQLPVYERLGDVRSRAVTQGKIADILQARGELDEALRIYREVLPVYERLGDVRLRAITQGKIADILRARGDLDEALRIRTEEQLPVYERLGDVRSRAITQGKIANILQARGEFDEAIRIYREDVLPADERLGATRDLVFDYWNLGFILVRRGGEGDREVAGKLLHLALDKARQMQIPEAKQIEEFIEQAGLGGEIASLRSQ